MQNIANKQRSYYLKVIIYLILTFGIGYLPPFGAVTPMGMKVLGVFIGTVFGWMALGFIWPSLFAMAALGIIGYKGVNAVIMEGLGFNTLSAFILSFVLAAALAKTNAPELIANVMMKRKSFAGHPYLNHGADSAEYGSFIPAEWGICGAVYDVDSDNHPGRICRVQKRRWFYFIYDTGDFGHFHSQRTDFSLQRNGDPLYGALH